MICPRCSYDLDCRNIHTFKLRCRRCCVDWTMEQIIFGLKTIEGFLDEIWGAEEDLNDSR